MSTTGTVVGKLYTSVIEDVMANVRESFLDEGVDESVLTELKQLWESKLLASHAVDTVRDVLGGMEHGLPQQAAAAVPQQLPAAPQTLAAAPQTLASAPLPANVLVPVQINIPQAGGVGGQRSITVHVPAAALQGGAQTLQQVLNSPTMSAAIALPTDVAQQLLQQHVNASFGIQFNTASLPASVLSANNRPVQQVDGPADTSDEEDEEEDDDDDADDSDDDDADDHEKEEDLSGQDEEPLNSEDDVEDQDPSDLFETDNVVVCQYDKITRTRNKWKFHFKDGIMTLQGRDYVFQKANGDAEW